MIARLLALLWKPLAAILAFGWLRADARRDARLRAQRDALAGYRDTRERIDHADVAPDADAAREWLRRRKP